MMSSPGLRFTGGARTLRGWRAGDWEEVNVARTDNDSWEITESVGATALGVAAARAADTESDDPLIHDPFARVFLDAAGDGMWNWFGSSELPPEILEAEPDVPLRMQGMRDYMASRTRFFDQFFLEDRKSTRLNSSHITRSRMPSSA